MIKSLFLVVVISMVYGVSMMNIIGRLVPFRDQPTIKDFFKLIKSFRYFGDKYKCPFCKGNFSTFMPIGVEIPVLKKYEVVGGGYRTNAICPRCYAGDRERVIQMYLEKEKSYIYKDNLKMLHVAPEPNLMAKFKSSSNITYISADIDPDAADIQMDITDIQQDDAIYDVIICNHVLEHINDDLKAMKELLRVLKVGGFAILQVPFSDLLDKTFEDFSKISKKERLETFGQKDHVRIYGRDYVERLRKAGFSVEEHYFSLNSAQKDIEKYRLLEKEKLFICSKSQ